jgi:hypothetical protein
MNDFRLNGKPRDIGDGTKRRRAREQKEQVLGMMLYRPTLDLPPEPPTRQQLRKSEREMAKTEKYMLGLERRINSRHGKKLSKAEERNYRAWKRALNANS